MKDIIHINGKMRRLHLLLLAFLLSSVSAFAQVVRGTVYDEEGQPMIGVNVIEQNTTTGVMTDVDGRFHLTLKKSSSAVEFTYVGYEAQTIAVKGGDNIEVNMEVSSTVLDSEDLSRTASTSVANALVGKVSGLTFRQKSGIPGTAATIQVRGMGEPLYVIDGIMKDADAFNNLDVNDIANISILKDGAAAIYGVKAANGVVLVTTKTGKRGQKTQVNLNANVGWSGWTKYPELLNAYQWKYANYMKSVNSGNLVGADAIAAAQADLQLWKQGYYEPGVYMNPTTGEDYRGFDWYDEFVNNHAPQYYVNANIQGGSERSDYYISVSHISQDAVFDEYTYRRTNIQGNFNYNITDKFKVGGLLVKHFPEFSVRIIGGR